LALGFDDEFAGKWAELLKEVTPQVSRVGILWNPEARGLDRLANELTTVGARLGLSFDRLPVRSVDDLDGAFATATRARVGGLVVITDPLTLRHRAQIVKLAAQARLPAVYGFGEFSRAGGLMAYGPSVTDLARRTATYVDRILKGAKPADIPIEQPTKFELVINLKTAKALGLTIPSAVLARADEVIE
jgi:ABC-type uncharacterized transport system substrate-binding protein